MAQPVTVKTPSGKTISVPTGLFINNEFVPSSDSPERIEHPLDRAVNPATEEVICSVVAASSKDIDLAVAAARHAFETTWGKNVTGVERSRLINKFADLIERDAQILAELEALNNVPSLGSVGGAALAAHPDVDKVAFTGSTITGHKVMEAAAKSNLKKVSLELGGKSPHLVFSSADLDQAANWAALGICYNSGQDCTAGSRVYVQDDIYDKFIDILVSKVKAQIFGDGFDEKSGGGPVVSKGQYDRVWNYIESGKQEGAKAIVGGVKRTGKGFFVDPTIFTEIRPDMKIVKEEIFGPVLSVGRFKTEEEAIALANDTTYGLGAGLHSNDANQCMRVSSALEAGTVWVNQYNILNNNVPFGGKKQSGIGRELGSYALEEYTSVKAIHWNFGEKIEWPL
ncbi:hypothetical protein H0H87_005652 [Tephrocybe sp. NHM501043]|nr:hypothetical protein H0H87_005652 [Tephrocybe sp. NHM501043]